MKGAAGALLAVLLLAGPAAAEEPGRIVVTGQASAEVAPDFATVEVAVETRGATPAAALDQSSAAAAKVVALAREFGAAGPDVATTAVVLRPATRSQRDPNGSVREVADGYQAVNAVRIRLRDLPRLGALVRRIIDTGADRINGIGFGLLDPARAEAGIEAEAVRDARRRAETLADAAGLRLGRVERITTSPQGAVPPPYPMARALAAKAPGASVPVEPGTVEVAASVEVTWAIAP
ncbi:SIMPL domain-containing protein [uncultured Methylobacterium sp.]|uniref:SIMPL domain-containing protein n=1 Tax=uncultured Methylobacterium sp. TaxID=157278 RepID=UPI0026047D91|nr:SIMPL domain-containing protein [uncultured Methylobacterium sp.]